MVPISRNAPRADRKFHRVNLTSPARLTRSQEAYRNVHGGGHVIVRWVKKIAPDGHASHVGQLQSLLPAREHLVWTVANLAAEQEDRQCRCLSDAFHVVYHRNLQPAIRRGSAQP